MASLAEDYVSTNSEDPLYRTVDPDQDTSNANVFSELGVHYLSSNVWSRHQRSRSLRAKMAGVAIRALTKPHPLAGEHGLFATQKFAQYDVVGEYIGEVCPKGVSGGEYVAYLENGPRYALLNGLTKGNEGRFVNSHAGISPTPNVSMRVAYIEKMPRIMLICTRAIVVGDEFLLDYGEEYNDHYLRGGDAAYAVKTAAMAEKNARQKANSVDTAWADIAPFSSDGLFD